MSWTEEDLRKLQKDNPQVEVEMDEPPVPVVTIEPSANVGKDLKLYFEYKDFAEDREEFLIQKDVAHWWRYWREYHPLLWYCHAIPNGGKRPISVAKKMKAEGVEPGVPDVYIPYPSHDDIMVAAESGYVGLAIEHKRKGNYPSPEQRDWLNRLAVAGWRVCVSWSAAASRQIIKEHLRLPESVLSYP